MTKILGLDLGTNSIGWAVVNDEKGSKKVELEEKGTVIFSEGIIKDAKSGAEKSKTAARTENRGSRRLNFRRKLRKYETLLVLAKYKMCPLTVEEVKDWRSSNFKNFPSNPNFLLWLQTDNKDDKNLRVKQIENPYFYRDKASREKISNLQLGRAFYHIAQRRGFLSNRLDQTDENIIKEKKDEIEDIVENNDFNIGNLKTAIEKIENIFEGFDFKNKKKTDCSNETEKKLWSIRYYIINIVIGNKNNNKDFSTIAGIKKEVISYVNKPESLGKVAGKISALSMEISKSKCETLGQYFYSLFKGNRHDEKNKIRGKYTAREKHYIVEFEKICQIQKLFGINIDLKEPSKRYFGVVKELYRGLFYQRPLKSQKGLVGKCTLEPTKSRCPVSRIEFEEFRMFSYINTIKIKVEKGEKFRFLTKEEKKKIESLFYRKSKLTFSFQEIIDKLGVENDYNYNKNTIVSGCQTIANFRLVFGNDYKKVITDSYTEKSITDRKTGGIERLKTADEQVADVWHVLFTFNSDEKLKEFASNKLKLDEKTAKRFSKIRLKSEYANLSLSAINKILPYLKKELLYSHAVFMANLPELVVPKKWNDEKTQERIEEGIGEIIDNHQDENKRLFVINSLLTNCLKDGNNFTYSKESHKGLKDDLTKKLKIELGKKQWGLIKNQEEFIEDTFSEFVESLEEKKHIKIERIDQKIIKFLKGENSDGEIYCEDDKLINKKLYHPSDIEKFRPVTIKDKEGNEINGLGSPEVGSIKNPVVMRSLHQLKKLINLLLIEGKIDRYTKINIELARELNDSNKRIAIGKWQKDRADLYKLYADKIKELYPKENNGKVIDNLTDIDIERFGYILEQRKDGKIVSREDVEKYTSWEEQKHICIYTGKQISLSSFLGKNPEFDIEHTLPRSRSWDNSQMNKTLCEKKYNRNIKKNKIPYELSEFDQASILNNIDHWKEKYEKLDNEIKSLVKKTKNPTLDVDKKNKIIQDRHYKKLEYDYWKGKHNRFIMEEVKEGFKNSQSVDIGIISKYAIAYVKSVFDRVYSVKGQMVSEYRKAWGVNITKKDENGKEKKDRDNHIHHCIDAVTIACMDKYKYDRLVNAWTMEEKGEFEKARKELAKTKPWKTFTEDVRNLKNEVLIVHNNKSVLPIQSKRKARNKGKLIPKAFYKKDDKGNYLYDEKRKKIIDRYDYQKDENGNKIPVRGKKLSEDELKGKVENEHYFVVSNLGEEKYYEFVLNNNKEKVFQKGFYYEQGDTARCSLHNTTFYGAIKQAERDENDKVIFDDKKIRLQKDKNGEEIVTYVVRRELTKLKLSEVAKIVDKNIRVIVEQAKKENIIVFNKSGASLTGTIWQNKEKGIPLKKVRIIASVKNPLKDFKKHATPYLSSKEYKRQFNVSNEENYCMAIYEGKNDKGELTKDFELVNNRDAAIYYKLSNKKHREDYELIPRIHNISKYPLKYQNKKPVILMKGLSVLLLRNKDECVEWGDQNWLKNRLYKITGIDKDGIKLNYGQEARMGTEIIKFMNEIINFQEFESIMPVLLEVKDLDIKSIKLDFYNPNVKKNDLFEKLQNILNNYYIENEIKDSKGKIKTIKLKESKLTTPKGKIKDVIDNYNFFPYIKLKASGFYAKVQDIDFKISQIGKIEEV